MRRHGWLVVFLAVLVLAAPASAAVRPTPFRSCKSLVGYARRHFAVTHGVAVGAPRPIDVQRAPVQSAPNGAVPPAAAQPTEGSADFSTTNNQEQGVDEPDIVKTDGSTIFTVSGTTLRAVTVTGTGAPKLAGSLALGAEGFGAQLMLRGSRLIVISSGGGPVVFPTEPGIAQPAIAPAPFRLQTVVTEVDVHDPAAMKITRTLTVDGTFVDARQNGSTARLVVSSTPRAIPLASTRARASGWVPARRFRSRLTGRHYVRPVAGCRAIARPAQFSGLGMLTILTIDLDRGLWAADSDALMADAQVVYGSSRSLYVATQKWVDPGTALDRLPRGTTTVIERFDVTDPDRTKFVAAGEVPGYLLNQFSLGEYKGRLRVASTSDPIWWTGPQPQQLAPSESHVTVLETRGDRMVPVGRVSGLGRGERIYSVRFLGDRGYVVTFRQVDPLFTLDLSSPEAPKVAGRLELAGFSSYLHPISADLLLGIGQAVPSAGGAPRGTQLELFDVSRAAAPELLARTTLGGGSSSEAQYDHHAFLFWPATKLAVLPVQIFGTGAPAFTGAIGYHVDAAGIGEVGRITHDAAGGATPLITRSVVIGDRLFTVSDAGVMASGLGSLARQAFVAFGPQA